MHFSWCSFHYGDFITLQTSKQKPQSRKAYFESRLRDCEKKGSKVPMFWQKTIVVSKQKVWKKSTKSDRVWRGGVKDLRMDFGGEFGALQSGKAFQVGVPRKTCQQAVCKSFLLQHPVVCLCHVGFRTCALLVYLFGGMFSSSFIGVFVSVVLLLSIDFWTVKNITGRILVRKLTCGLRVLYDTVKCQPSWTDRAGFIVQKLADQSAKVCPSGTALL